MEINIDILTSEQLNALDKMIKEAEHIVICCHKSPDGDAIGSSLGFYQLLRSAYGKEANVVIPDMMPDFLQWLPDSDKIMRYDTHEAAVKSIFSDADLILCLDFNDSSRVDDMQPVLDAAKGKKIMIDHHLDPNMETALTISHPEMCSTCELVFRIAWQMGFYDSASKAFAESIYCGMMTDTGGFTYNSTRSEIFFIVCQLLTKNIDKDKIYRNVFNNYSSWAIRLRGHLLCDKLNVFEDLHASYYALTKQDMDDYHFIKGDVEGLVNEPLRIKGMKLSISMREDNRKANKIWVSVRSVDDFPANKVAEQFFNGGGHLNAAGGHLECSIDEACLIARKAINAFAEELKK
jgi:phosphoesterase RecJ-like protein